MKRMLMILLPVLTIMTACVEEAKLIVHNNVSNVTLSGIAYGSEEIGYYLLPGEDTGEVVISKKKKDFPLSHEIKFYMQKSDKSVYLHTKEIFKLDYDENLVIKITDETEVLNPMLSR